MKLSRLFLSLLLVAIAHHSQGQRFENFYQIPKSELKKTLDESQKLCPLANGKWVNSSVSKMETDHYGKFTIVHFGSFDNFISQADIQDLTAIQNEFPQIRVILSLNPKFDYPKETDDILFELAKRQIPLPVYLDKNFELWQCMGVEFWPTTLFVGPKGSVIEKHEGRLNLSELRTTLPEVINRLAPMMDSSPEPFYGIPPSRWNKRTVLDYPSGLAVNSRESMIFVSDQLGHRILGLTKDGNVIYCIGNGAKGSKDGALAQATFNQPRGMAMDEDNFVLYVADSRNHLIRKIDLMNDVVTTVLGNGRQPNKVPRKVSGTGGPIDSPCDLLLIENDLYISMQGTNQIWRMDIRTEVATPFAGSGDFGFTNDNSRKSQLAAPSGLTTDISEAVFFTDAQASALRYVADGEVKTSVGQGIFDFGYQDGKKDKIKLRYPNGMTSYDEKIYLADTYNHSIRIIEPFKRKSETLVGDPKMAGYRNGFEALFNQPMDVEVLGEDLIVADAGNGALRKVNLSSSEVSSIPLINYECIGQGLGSTMDDLRDGPDLIIAPGLNEITYTLDLGELYELDPTAFQSVLLNTRTPGIELINSDMSDGSIDLELMPDTTVRRQAFTLDFSIFIRSKQDPFLQYRKDISFFHQVKIDQQTPVRQEILVPYDPDKGRD
jgi:hypothetical protein